MTPEQIAAMIEIRRVGATLLAMMGDANKASEESALCDLIEAQAAELATLRLALTKLRDLMCEAIEDDDGNSGCGQCENDCTGCIADRALKGGA